MTSLYTVDLPDSLRYVAYVEPSKSKRDLDFTSFVVDVSRGSAFVSKPSRNIIGNLCVACAIVEDVERSGVISPSTDILAILFRMGIVCA